MGDIANSYAERNSRTIRMIGEGGMARLRDARVAVFGLGGVGSACVESLARCGVGSLLVVDKDDVELSNLNRQAIAFRSTLGLPKTEAMRKMVLDINPDTHVEELRAFVNAENIEGLLEPFAKPDYIVDALDTLSVKAALMQHAQRHSVPIVSAMGGANKTDPAMLEFADLQDTRICPLCREMRKIARDRGIEGVQVLYSAETPVKVAAREGAERHEKTELGTLSYFPPIMGLMIAGYVIREILSPHFQSAEGGWRSAI